MKKAYIKNIFYIIIILTGFILLIRLGLSSIIGKSNQSNNISDSLHFSHPSGIIKPAILKDVKAQLGQEPYKTFYKVYEQNTLKLEEKTDNEIENVYDIAYLSARQAFLYQMTNEKDYAEKSWKNINIILEDDEIFTNPISRGLTRATLLQQASLAYDFAYEGWDETKKKKINDLLYKVMFTTNANMGYSANYSIASNWMGVRYGSVVLTSQIWDNTETTDRSPHLPILWDSFRRLRNHLDANLYENGWNGESMGYHNYDWSFVGPAIIALQNNSSSNAFELENYAPKAINSLWGLSTSTIAIPTNNMLGVKADLSDDNLNSSLISTLAIGMRIYPEEQLPAIKWMHDYLFDPEIHYDSRGGLMYSMINYPDTIKAVNPSELGWLNYHDPEQGVVIFRNRFKDENDIVSTYTATSKRVQGHKGPDTNTFRLIGLGVPWFVGAGRTSEVAGQTNLFPAKDKTPLKGSLDSLGTLHDYKFLEDYSGGYALGSGSCVGVENHKRFYYTNYSKKTGANALLVIADRSDNGRRFRINTPEFNRVVIENDGFTIVGPNGANLKATVLEVNKPLQIKTGKVRYGGSTKRNNPGIHYKGEQYEFNHWIDVYNNGNIFLVITLQEQGKVHPNVIKKGRLIEVGEVSVEIPEEKTWR